MHNELSINRRPEVMIVGAGPTGLMAACRLALSHIPFRIIDKNKEPVEQSRALVIHAASMELFSQMGLAKEFMKYGKQTKAINYFAEGKVMKRIPLSEFGKGLTAFPSLLMLEQSRTERLLVDFLKRLGHEVERETELISVRQNDHGVQLKIKRIGGDEENVETNWLIAADGA